MHAQNTLSLPDSSRQATRLRPGGPPSPSLSGRLHFLDALRGLAALSVVLFHFYTRSVSPIHQELANTLPTLAGRVLDNLRCGVEIFFILSGFVIAFSMRGSRHDLPYAGNFIVRRSLRLDPPYWISGALTLSVLICKWPHLWYDFYVTYGGWKGITANLFYVQNLRYFYPAASIVDVSWTLCLEVQFYLSYLLLLVAAYYLTALAGRHGQSLRRVLVGLAVAAIGVWSFWYWIRIDGGADYAHRAWMFFLGVGLQAALARRVPVSLVLLVLLPPAAWFGWKGDPASVVALLTAAAIYTVGGAGRFSTFLAYRPLLHLGKISYSLYLVHMTVGVYLLAMLRDWTGTSSLAGWFNYTVAVVASLLAAELLHRLVEAPSNRLSQRLKRRPPAAETPRADAPWSPLPAHA